MKKFYSLFLVVTLIFTFIPNALALEKWVHFDSPEEMENTVVKFTISGDEITSTKLETESIDNSNLTIKVIQPIGDGELREIYRGPMSGLKDGPWQYVDYSKVSVFAVLIELKDSLEVLYIIPLEEEQNEIQGSKMEEQNTKSVSNDSAVVEYDITYEITRENNVLTLVSQFSITNLSQTVSEPVIIAGLYKNGMLEGIVNKKITLQGGATLTDELEQILPCENIDEYYVKLMVWDSFTNLVPLGESKLINDLNICEREKYLLINETQNNEFNVFMNSVNSKGGDSQTLHIIEYNPENIALVDLCRLTYEKELVSGNIENTGIVIDEVDTANGMIKYRFISDSEKNTGINNVIRFKALNNLNSEQIKYIIQ